MALIAVVTATLTCDAVVHINDAGIAGGVRHVADVDDNTVTLVHN